MGDTKQTTSEDSNAPKCRRCLTPLVSGVAIANTLVSGMPDFPGDTEASRGQTMHYGGAGKMVPVLKCPKCGHSVARLSADKGA